jgi:transcriptional regulator with XRE-family HTH domain
MQPVLKASRPRFSREPFSVTLKSLMKERRLSYRQLAYKTQLSAGYLNHLTKGTRPVPADTVIRVIAGALLVEPDHFVEYRIRQLSRVLGESSQLVDSLYEILLLNGPIPDDIEGLLADRPNGSGDADERRSASGF